MAHITIRNISAGPVSIPEIPANIAVGGKYEMDYLTTSFPNIPSLIEARNNGEVTVQVDYEVYETPSETESEGEWDYLIHPVSFCCRGFIDTWFAETNHEEVFQYAVAEGLTVIKVDADHGGDVQAAIDAAQAAGAGSIVFFDVAYDVEEAATLTVADDVPIQIVGFSRDPAQTKLKRAAAGVFAIILRINAGATMAAAMTNRLRPNRMLVRDITFDGQGGAAGLSGFRIINTGDPMKYVTVENCVSIDCTTYGFCVEGLSGGLMEDFIYEDCVSYGCATGWKHDQGAMKGCKFINCKGHDNTMTGAYLRSDFQDLQMIRCEWKNNGEYGVLVEESTSVRSHISDCIFLGNGWQVGPNNPGGLLFYVESNDNIDDVVVEKCIFQQNGVWQPFSAADGDDHGVGLMFKVKSAEVQNVTIEECDFIDNGHFGVHGLARDSYDAYIHDITIKRCNFRGHYLAAVSLDDMSGYAASLGETCNMMAISNFWGSIDGAADAPTASGYTSAMYTGAGHGGSGDACLSSTPKGYKKETNEGETRYPATITVLK